MSSALGMTWIEKSKHIKKAQRQRTFDFNRQGASSDPTPRLYPKIVHRHMRTVRGVDPASKEVLQLVLTCLVSCIKHT